MSFMFPNPPLNTGSVTVGPNGATWIWDGSKWIGASGGPFLTTIGGTMTGPLILDDGSEAASQNWTLQHTIWPDAPIDGQSYSRMQGAWNPVLPMTGGIMRGPINMANFQLTGLRPPVAPTDAVPRNYVDNAISLLDNSLQQTINNLLYFNINPPPAPVQHKQLWAQPTGTLFIFDSTISAWIQIAGPSLNFGGGGGGGPGSVLYTGVSPPDPSTFVLWWDETDAQLYVWQGSAWVVAVNVPTGISGGTF